MSINNDVWSGYGLVESCVRLNGVLGNSWTVGYMVLEWQREGETSVGNVGKDANAL